jgi:ubiquinone/menaquinone biosynthesis C-methylase UbiE
MANWYERHVLPTLINVGCGCATVAAQRAKVVPFAAGHVLELGIGGGRNLAFYDPAKVSAVTGIDPSDELRALAAAAPRPAGLAVDIRPGVAEQLPFADASFDTVLCTFTLCSAADPQRALAEARRVLRPGGRFLFCEHGRAPDPGVQRWQERLDPVWRRLFGGCHLSRPVGGAIARHFTIQRLDSCYLPGTPRPVGWNEWGEAKAG